jgi:hypothetical protein
MQGELDNMALYVQYDRFGSTTVAQYTGMTEDVITVHLQDLGAANVTFLTEEAYLAALPPITH